jgi:hypothetical protein
LPFPSSKRQVAGLRTTRFWKNQKPSWASPLFAKRSAKKYRSLSPGALWIEPQLSSGTVAARAPPRSRSSLSGTLPSVHAHWSRSRMSFDPPPVKIGSTFVPIGSHTATAFPAVKSTVFQSMPAVTEHGAPASSIMSPSSSNTPMLSTKNFIARLTRVGAALGLDAVAFASGVGVALAPVAEALAPAGTLAPAGWIGLGEAKLAQSAANAGRTNAVAGTIDVRFMGGSVLTRKIDRAGGMAPDSIDGFVGGRYLRRVGEREVISALDERLRTRTALVEQSGSGVASRPRAHPDGGSEYNATV